MAAFRLRVCGQMAHTGPVLATVAPVQARSTSATMPVRACAACEVVQPSAIAKGCAMADDAVDFAVVAWREDGRWQVAGLPPRAASSLESLVHALRQQPGDSGTLGMVAVADDFFVIVRVGGEQVRLLLSDVTASSDWEFAATVAAELGIEAAEELDDIEPAGDLAILSDFGLDARELAMLCDDAEMYPDEVLSSVAARVGFGDAFDAAVSAS